MKKNNKGFSLMELIIVIAIMAVMVAVLAPQYLKYVEKAKKSTDLSNFTQAVNMVDTALADPDLVVTGPVVQLNWYTTGANAGYEVLDNGSVSTSADSVCVAWRTSISGNTSYVAKSRFAKGLGVVSVLWTLQPDLETWDKTISGGDAGGECAYAAGCY